MPYPLLVVKLRGGQSVAELTTLLWNWDKRSAISRVKSAIMAVGKDLAIFVNRPYPLIRKG